MGSERVSSGSEEVDCRDPCRGSRVTGSTGLMADWDIDDDEAGSAGSYDHAPSAGTLIVESWSLAHNAIWMSGGYWSVYDVVCRAVSRS